MCSNDYRTKNLPRWKVSLFVTIMKSLITITTDFGDSFASAQLKAVIASLGYTGVLIETIVYLHSQSTKARLKHSLL